MSDNVLKNKLDSGALIVAEGYLFEMERRGYLQAGAFVPEVVLEHPEALVQLHEEFARAGSDVMQAFTYYAHREKLRVIGRENDLEPMNREALKIARRISDKYNLLMAGNISNTNIWEKNEPSTQKEARKIFEEQVAWAAEEGADFIVGETFTNHGEALCALEVMKTSNLPTVVTLAVMRDETLFDGYDFIETCKQLEANGAEVVGLNCARGIDTTLPLVKRIREAVSCHVAALPVPYRTTEASPTMQSIPDTLCTCELPNSRPFPDALDPYCNNRYECAEFAKNSYAADIRYIGLCCGAGPHQIRAIAEALGRTPPASKYSPDMSKHAFFGTDSKVANTYKERVVSIT